MQTRQEQLIVILAQSQGWLKGRDLAALLGVSDRTIRSDMNKLKQDYPGAIQTHHHKGYRLVAQVLEDPNQPSPLGLPQTQEERLHYLLKLLLAESASDPQGAEPRPLCQPPNPNHGLASSRPVGGGLPGFRPRT